MTVEVDVEDEEEGVAAVMAAVIATDMGCISSVAAAPNFLDGVSGIGWADEVRGLLFLDTRPTELLYGCGCGCEHALLRM